MRITTLNLPMRRLGIAVLFAGAVFLFALPSLSPFFPAVFAGDPAVSSKAPAWELTDIDGNQ